MGLITKGLIIPYLETVLYTGVSPSPVSWESVWHESDFDLESWSLVFTIFPATMPLLLLAPKAAKRGGCLVKYGSDKSSRWN